MHFVRQELEDDEIETERIPWALKAKRELLKDMKKYEIERQENIRELVYTERTHLQKLKIMKYVSAFVPISLSLSLSLPPLSHHKCTAYSAIPTCLHTMSDTQMYKDPLQKRNILSAQQAEQLFPSLEELILFHNTLCTDLKERVGPVQNETCKNIADVLLQRLSIFQKMTQLSKISC